MDTMEIPEVLPKNVKHLFPMAVEQDLWFLVVSEGLPDPLLWSPEELVKYGKFEIPFAVFTLVNPSDFVRTERCTLSRKLEKLKLWEEKVAKFYPKKRGS